MKLKGLAAAFCILLASVCLQASERVVLLPGSAIWLEGDSTLHRFSSTSTALSAEIDGASLSEIKSLVVRIPVASLKSSKAALDKNLYKALQSKEYPEIIFRMRSYEMIGSIISAKGELSIAGRSRDVVLEGRASAEEGKTRVDGSYDLLMTDFGIKPPVMMLGTLKTRNEITVRYILYIDFK